jgi:serine phosphatase RsbU (regulator of sigma subunit)
LAASWVGGPDIPGSSDGGSTVGRSPTYYLPGAIFCANVASRLAPLRFLFQNEESPPVGLQQPVQSKVPRLHDAELAAVYYGQRQAGDFYDFMRVSPHRVVFGLLDVAGRLEDSRAAVTAAQHTFRTLGAKLLAAEDVNQAEAMMELCLGLNRSILAVEGGIHPCPAFAGCYDENLGIICYFNAGHTPGLLRDSTGVSELPATGLPLGLFSHATCDAPMIALEAGAALLLISRGMVEGKCKGEEFGLARAKNSLQRTTAETAREFCLTLLDQVKQFMCTPPTHDDVTALALVRSATAKAFATGRG